MIDFIYDNRKGSTLDILCLGAHCDDIEIGCGGTMLHLQQLTRPLNVTWIVFSSDIQRRKEAERSAGVFLKNVKRKKVILKNYKNGFFPYSGGKIKKYFENLKHEIDPDVIFTHYRHDLHQDHRVISDLTWNTFRRHLILEYEVPKYDGDLSSPNVLVRLDEMICKEKINNIMRHYKSQKDKHWFSADLFLSILRLRGIEAGNNCRYAEGFYGRKIILG